ncbi:hypothetical protein [Azorhizobium oxalatiphilum]|uniref:hypothetical protein n=1 Tax=Azorhizobium oxalatiphilum TaxID=980631 RepID=UPI001AEEDBCF|nr:hypothetical protein [Azorhizobium oxalatiphilum]
MVSFIPSNALTAPDGSRTERPRHFSVKNIVPSGKKAMSQVNSRPDITVVLARPGTPLAAWGAVWDVAGPAMVSKAAKVQGNTNRIARVIDASSGFLTFLNRSAIYST